MEELINVDGFQEFLGKKIPVINGGFGNNQKCVLAKTIAEIHGVETKEINKLINNNIDEFEFGIDILDLKTGDCQELVLENRLLTKAQYGNAKNLYLLSEQGYIALIGLMRTDKSKEIRRQFRREYFRNKEQLQIIAKHQENNLQVTDKIIDLLSSSIDNKLDKKISEMDRRKEELENFYKPTHKRKLDLNKFIKNSLGVNYSRENSDKVKEISLQLLGNYHIWEEVPMDILNNKETSELIYKVCVDFNNSFGKSQLRMNI